MQKPSKSSQKEVKILLVDDHQLLMEGVGALLSREPEYEVVNLLSNGLEAWEYLRNNPVDVVVCDMSMPKMTGLELLRNISPVYPEIRVVILSMNRRKALISEVMNSGASGYVLKDESQRELVACLRTVCSGKTFVSQRVGKILLQGHGLLGENEDLANLTGREVEILKLISRELSNTEIGKVLDISRRTVETHRKNIMKKIGAKNSIGLARYAYSHGYHK